MSEPHFSSVGASFSGIYAIGAGVIFYKALTCHGEFCGFIGLIPILPWTFVVEYFPNFTREILDGVFGLFFFAIVNATILYFVGASTQSLFGKLKARI